MTARERDALRRDLAIRAIGLLAERGSMIGKADLAAHTRTSRARIDDLFPEEGDLFDAVVEQWYADDVTIMEEVIASALPIPRKFFEFFARRYRIEVDRLRQDPALFALCVELGSERFEQVRGYIDLADHYLSELIAQAQAEGHFPGLSIDQALTLINQMVVCYTSPQMLMLLGDRLSEDKLAVIIDTLFAGLAGGERGARSVASLRAAS